MPDVNNVKPEESNGADGSTAPSGKVSPAAKKGKPAAKGAPPAKAGLGKMVFSNRLLRVHEYHNEGGSISYTIRGQLPIFETKVAVPEDLKEMLIPGKKPEPQRQRFETEAEARSLCLRIEALYDDKEVKRVSRETVLSEEQLELHEQAHRILRPFTAAHPDAILEAAQEFAAVHGNELIKIGLREFVMLMIQELGPTVSPRRPQRWRWAAAEFCEVYGVLIEEFDRHGERVKEMPLGEVTQQRLNEFKRTKPRDLANQVLPLLRVILDYAVELSYLRTNPAIGFKVRRLFAERVAKAEQEVAIESNANVLIALNLAAEHRGGYFMPHVVLLYFAALRPECELLRIGPKNIKLIKRLIRLYSTKTTRRRIIHLSANAVAMLKAYWDGGPLKFDGWDQFLALMRAAQGYDVTPPVWFTAPTGTRRPLVPDIGRHTGSSHYIWWGEWAKRTYRNGNAYRTFMANYDGLTMPEDAAQFLSLVRLKEPVTDELRAEILAELTAYNLVADGKLPAPPIVPQFIANPPPKVYWKPTQTDTEIRDLIFSIGLKAAAEQLGTSQRWLGAICAAKRIPVPKAARYRPKPETAPIPPPLVTLPPAELEAYIRKLHGVGPAAAALGIDGYALTAYCYLNNIPTPTRLDISTWAGKRPRIKFSPQQVRVLLARHEFAVVAEKAGVSEEHLRKYCHDRGIAIPDPAARAAAKDEATLIQTAVAREFASRNGNQPSPDEAMELVLRHAPRGLPDEEISVLLKSNGFPLGPAMVRQTLRESVQGRFENYDGRWHLLVRKPVVNLDDLQQNLQAEINGTKGWTMLGALRCALARTPAGLSIEQLLVVLPWFGLQVDQATLTQELKRYDHQVRVILYRGQVTLPETPPDWKQRVDEPEPTPNYAAIQAQVCKEYGRLANRKLTNVELMEFVFSLAPDGLWVDEFMQITKLLKVDFKIQCIHSVAGHEAKERFQRRNGRLTLVGPPTKRVTMDDLHAALDGRVKVPRNVTNDELFIEVLRHFPLGLALLDLEAAVALHGYQSSHEAFRRKVYYLRAQGRVCVKAGLVTVEPPKAL